MSSMKWWGQWPLAEGQGGRFIISDLRLWVSRFPGEWRIAIDHGDEPFDATIELDCPGEPVEPPESADAQRYASKREDDEIDIVPVLADRPVVARPEQPFNLLPGDEVRLFITTAVWVRLQVGDPETTLTEAPIVRSSDTWFGPSTREGELCYAAKTAARMHLDNVPRRPGRAITRVNLRNRAEDSLPLERISIPVPALSVFGDEEGQLWTETITVERGKDGIMTEVKIGKTPPSEAVKPALLASPRRPEDRNELFRALEGIWR